MDPLTAEDHAVLDLLRRATAARAAVPPPRQVPISQPAKYSAVIGRSDDGGWWVDEPADGDGA